MDNDITIKDLTDIATILISYKHRLYKEIEIANACNVKISTQYEQEQIEKATNLYNKIWDKIKGVKG